MSGVFSRGNKILLRLLEDTVISENSGIEDF